MMSSESSLVDLPDEILLQVMSYLTTSDLLLLARTCRRLCGLLSDRSLWREVDLRQSRLRARQLGRLLRHLHAETHRVCLAGHVRRGRPQRQPLLTARCLNGYPDLHTELAFALTKDIKTRCESLVELRLERCLLNAREMPLDLLPDSLLSLSLRGSEVTHRPAGRSYFYRLWELTPRLTELDLSSCGWLHSHALLPLSKLAQLRRLTLRDCPRLGGEVAYSSIACMLGFRALRALDVRRTQVADSDVSGFCQLPQLSELLLEPRRRGLLDGDTALRQLGQHRGGQLRRLALRGCPLREQSVSQLPQLLPELRQLDLTRANVPAERRRWLAEQLTKCVVSCHEPKQEPDPEPDQGPGPAPDTDRDPPEPGRRRRRSQSPLDPSDGAPPGKRPRRQHCQCVRCAAGSDGEEDLDDIPEDQPEEGQQDLEDLENRPGVIVVNLFDQGRVVHMRNGVAREFGGEPGRDVDADADGGGRAVGDVQPAGEGQAGGGDVPAAEAVEDQQAGNAQGEEGGVAVEGDAVVRQNEEQVAAEGTVAARGAQERASSPAGTREDSSTGSANNATSAQQQAPRRDGGGAAGTSASTQGNGQLPSGSASGDEPSEATSASSGTRLSSTAAENEAAADGASNA